MDHVKEMLETPLWIQHRQCWSIREEMFLEWAAVERESSFVF